MKPPVSLPPFTFLMSDHTTRQLACDVAEELSKIHDGVYVDDFLLPIHDGLAAMMELDMKRDLGSPRNTNRLVTEAVKESTEQDLIVSLEKWHIETFGEHHLGQLAFKRAMDNRANYEYSYVFRDATVKHLDAFKSLAPRDMYRMHLLHTYTVDEVVNLILKAA